MAYCPKCDSIVDEKWIECPVCRTPVVEKKTFSGVVRPKTPQVLKKFSITKISNSFLRRILGVLTFNGEVIREIASKKPEKQIIYFYLIEFTLGLTFLLLKSNSLALPSFPLDALNKLFIIGGFFIGTLVGLLLLIIYCVVAHFTIKLFAGWGELKSTIVLLLYIIFVWGIIGSLIGYLFNVLGLPPSGAYLIHFLVWILVLVESVIGLSLIHETSRFKSAVAVVLSTLILALILLVISLFVFVGLIFLGIKLL